ncbi:hypothetical protein F8M41_013112 [Gigaspora margarita]|uniref:Uncharacterized protein n=1 Tax=Gigaspora margarita TaxID=4874 RepID=A0A8H4ASH0_GIGMA|nr:hypothetical protein F8M41_013112 [Gigaspora margarita]
MNNYEAIVIDRIYHLDLGLFKHQINFTCSLLKEKYRASILDTIDNRLANIPRFSELKIFKNSIQSLARITTNKYRNLMKVMIFVLDNLNIDKSIQNKLLKLYEDWNNMHLLSRYEEFTDNDLKDFENLIINWAQQFIKLFKTNSASKLKFPKLHSWIYYTTDLIKKYSCLNGFSTETYESLHKDFVKTLYYLSNKQNIEDQIMKMMCIRDRLHSWIYYTTDLIKKYSCLNGFSTETYESLHKDFVKTLYYLSNKQNIEDQIMKMVQRQAIASKLLSRKPKNFKTINPFKFTNLIWIFGLNNAPKFIDHRLKNYRPNSKIYSGNIAVAMNPEELLEYLTDKKICYGQIYLLIKVETAKENVDNLLLIQWYDFKSTKN